MEDYRIEVKSWLLKHSTPDYDFMAKWNRDIPMPLMVMYGTKIGEAPKMTKFMLHGDIRRRVTTTCMCCGRPITNKVSQYFGIGPVCGGHNYVNPFSSEEELDKAVESYRAKLINTTWVGWIPNSSIISIDDNTDIAKMISDMPFEVTEDSEYLFKDADDYAKSLPIVNARIGTPARGTDDYSVFLSFKFNPSARDAIKENTRVHIWNGDTKEWEIEYKEFDKVKALLEGLNLEVKVTGEEILPKKVEVSSDYDFKTSPMAHQIEGIEYGLNHNRWLLADDQGLGKTKQIIDLAVIRKQTLGFKHCLIICGVNPLKWNWLEEIGKHSTESAWILGAKTTRTGKMVIGSNSDKLSDLEKLGNDSELDSHYFIITNVESLRNVGIASKLKELCDSDVINMVAIDEIHRCFAYDTLICTDVGDLKIGDIVSHKMNVNVKSFNLAENKIEWKPINGWFKNPVNQKLLELTIETSEGIKIIRCTDTHKFYTKNRGWVMAKDLLDTDELLGC